LPDDETAMSGGQASKGPIRAGKAARTSALRRSATFSSLAFRRPERTMFLLDTKSERIAALLLAVLMAATRIHHFGVGMIAPDASTGVFFLLGLMLARPFWFAAFAVEATLLDMVAIGVIGVADACMSLGYWTLFAGYLALWLAGRAARPIARLDLLSVGKLFCIASGGTVVFFVLSNLGYYFGGDFDDSMGVAEYVSRVSRYFSFYFVATLGYAVVGLVVFVAATRMFSSGRLAAR
jgi:hypothetical protein